MALWMSNESLKRLPRHDRRHSLDWFAAALAGFVLAFVFLLATEERPLRGSATGAASDGHAG